MEIQINGKPLAEISPAAARHIDCAQELYSLAINVLVSDLRKQLRLAKEALESAEQSNVDLQAELETVKHKLSRPKAGRVSTKQKAQATTRRAVPADTDDTTKSLMNEAYNGKKPISKSEARRLKTLREEDDGN